MPSAPVLRASRPRFSAGSHAERLAAWADAHDGVVGRAELKALGLTRHELATAVSNLRLRELHPSVWAVGHSALRQRGVRRAAVLAAGAGARLDRRTGAALHDLLRTNALEVAIPEGRRVPELRGVDVRRSRCLHPSELCEVDGLPTVTVARALLDLAGAHPKLLRNACERAVDLQVLDVGSVVAVLGRGRTGSVRLRAELERLVAPDAARFALERAFSRFLTGHGLPPAILNGLVEGFYVDVHWPAARLIVELDGWDTHRRRRSFEDDRRRDAALLVAGWRVVRITWTRLHDEPAVVAAQLHALLRAR